MQFVHKKYAHCAFIVKGYATKMKSTESNMSYDDERFGTTFSAERSKNGHLNKLMESQLCPVQIKSYHPLFLLGHML